MRGQNVAGEPDQVVAVMGDIGDNGTGFCHAISGPWGGEEERRGHDRPRDLRTGCICSCARIQS
jgi:hypothetical protein